MDVQAAIQSCRAERQYQRKDIPDSDLRKILDAGWRAPSGLEQGTRFIIVTHQPQLVELAKVGRNRGKDTKHVAAAPVAVGLVIPKRFWCASRERLQYDLGQASMAMQIVAAGLGIGSCATAVQQIDGAVQILKLVAKQQVCPYLITFGYPHGRKPAPAQHPHRRPFHEVVRRLRPDGSLERMT